MTPRRLRVGILDILTTPATSIAESVYNFVMTKQYASVTPQAIAVWCRALGHRTHYATYYGHGDPRRSLPADLDVIFIASYTQASALAYALAKLYRRAGVRTVIGGPHAKAFPADCARFFDVVVGDCDRTLVEDVLRGVHDPGTIVASAPFVDLPSVAERLPEIRASALLWGRRPYRATTIPLLASTGCPYRCDFCVDWNRPYRAAPPATITADLEFVARELPGAMVAYHDPNFAVRFDEVLSAMEALPPPRRVPYIIETSLSVLRGARAARMRDTNCVFVAPGVESWSGYSAKAGVGTTTTGRAKVQRLIEQFTEIHRYVPYIQANFLYGLDGDARDESIALTREFMEATPFVWPVVNIPHPFAGTPLFERHRREDRILRALPFSFYYSPYTATIPVDGSPVDFYRGLIEIFETLTAPGMLRRRLAVTPSRFGRVLHVARTRVKRQRLRAFRRLRDLLEHDAAFRAFHDGRSDALPELYTREYDRLLGQFAPLLSAADRRPVLQ